MSDHPETIQTFSQSPSVKVSTDELTDAEDQIIEKETENVEEDKDYREVHSEQIELSDPDEVLEDDDDLDEGSDIPKSELMAMDRYRLLATRILHKDPNAYMEYGTPSGSDNSQQCAGCQKGNEDAADAAIIDSGIEPASTTEKEEEKEESDEDTEGSFDASFKAVFDQTKNLLYLHDRYINGLEDITAKDIDIARNVFGNLEPATEGWTNISADEQVWGECSLGFHSLRSIFIRMVHSAWHITKKLGEGLIKVTKVLSKYLPPIYKKYRNKFDKLSSTSERLMILWETKLNKYVLRVDEDKLVKAKIKGFEYNDWITISRTLITLYEMIAKSGKTMVTDSSAADSEMKKMIVTIESIGLATSADSKRIDITELLKKRIVSNAKDMGFVPSKMETVMYTVKKLAVFFDAGKHLKFEDMFNRAYKQTEKTTLDIQKKTDGNESESSDELKAVAFNVLQSNLKIKYIASLVQIINDIAEMCIDEVHHIGIAYEKALAPTYEKVDDDKY